jgi:sulfofructose kinase
MTVPRVVCIGIATLDAIALVDRLPSVGERLPAREARLAGGGVAATAAVTLARLGVPVAFIGRVADDEAGRSIRAGLEREGVDVGGLRTVGGRTPVTVVLVDAATGERTLVPDVGGVPPIELGDADVTACAAAEWLHVDQTGYPALATARAAGVTTRVSLDGGNAVDRLDLAAISLYAPTERALFARYPGLDLDGAMAAVLAEGPELVVVTRGGRGSVALERATPGASADETGKPLVTTVAAFSSTVVSTLGAGDVFHGALLAALVERHGIPDALRRANAAAALACRSLDGRSAIPDRAELEAFLASAPDHPEVTHAG